VKFAAIITPERDFMRLRLWLPVALTLVAVVFGICVLSYAPAHWLHRIGDFGAVTVDGRPVRADMFIGHPTNNEADAFVLVHLSGANFLLNFDDDKFRTVQADEFIRLHWGVVFFKSVDKGNWVTPLPSQNLNEFRIPSGDHVVRVQF
jgi:hypothetical protein